jgi:hypothetical protein
MGTVSVALAWAIVSLLISKDGLKKTKMEERHGSWERLSGRSSLL